MRISTKQSRELELLSKAYEKSGRNIATLLDKNIASLIITGNKVLGLNNVTGVEVLPRQISHGVEADINIQPNIVLNRPIHICTGFLEKRGMQEIVFNIRIGDNSSVKFVAHCTFPWVEEFTHEALSNVWIGKNAKMSYMDEHHHSESGSINLKTTTKTFVSKGGYYFNSFVLTKTRVGVLNFSAEVELDDDAVAEMVTKIKASHDDRVMVREKIDLIGRHSRGIAKSVIVALDEAQARVVNEAYGRGDYSKGHIKCEEITKGKHVQVSTVPVLKVFNDLSELTHEASIGRVNAKQLETLMSKGLTEEEATNLIVKGLVS